MVAEFVDRAPEPLVLRHRDDHAPTRPRGLEHLSQDPLIIIEMLEDVERADDVEFRVEGHVASVHLDERDVFQPRVRAIQAAHEHVGGDHTQMREARAERRGNTTGPAPEVQKGFRPRENNGTSPRQSARSGRETRNGCPVPRRAHPAHSSRRCRLRSRALARASECRPASQASVRTKGTASQVR